MLRSTLVALILSPLVVLGADDPPPKVAAEELQGTWVHVDGYRANGERVLAETFQENDSRTAFEGDEMTNTSRGRSVTFKITTDPGKSPKEITSNFKSNPTRFNRLGIYRVKDDTLEIAWDATSSENERPTELAPCPKDSAKKWTYGIYRRAKEKKTP